MSDAIFPDLLTSLKMSLVLALLFAEMSEMPETMKNPKMAENQCFYVIFRQKVPGFP